MFFYYCEFDFQRIQPSKNLPIAQPQPPRITDVTHDEEDFWDRKPKPMSPGNGNWKKTLEHLFLNIYNYVKDEQELRELFGWKKFGRVIQIHHSLSHNILSFLSQIETARLIDKGGSYQIVTTFKKPLGEQSTHEEPPPVRKPNPQRRPPKRIRTPPDAEEKPAPPRHTETPPPSPPPTPPPHHDDTMHEEEKPHTPRIYTEETVVNYPNYFFLNTLFHLNSKTEHSYHFLILILNEVKQIQIK
jgi:hypothetical protein